jgi:hypothetical protein
MLIFCSYRVAAALSCRHCRLQLCCILLEHFCMPLLDLLKLGHMSLFCSFQCFAQSLILLLQLFRRCDSLAQGLVLIFYLFYCSLQLCCCSAIITAFGHSVACYNSCNCFSLRINRRRLLRLCNNSRRISLSSWHKLILTKI